jgi:MscS family membrane protein
MKVKFETWFGGFVVLLVLVLCWSIWNSSPRSAGAGATTPGAGSGQTNAPAASNVSSAKLTIAVDESDVTPEWVEKFAGDFPTLRYRWWGNELWKYLASLIYIFLAFYISKLIDFLTRVWLRRWANKTKTTFDDLLLELLNGPVKVVAFVIFLHIGLKVFHWPPKVELILTKGFTLIVASSLTYMTLKFVDLFLGYWRDRASSENDRVFDDQLFPVIRKSLKVFVIVIAVLVTAQNLDINVTAALTSLSIGGLAVGLAAQDTLSNLFGAASVFMDKPFRIGDSIRLDAVEGAVETIGMRSTRVRSVTGDLVTIPNKTVGNATIINLSRRSDIKTDINLGLACDTSVEKMRRALAILAEVYKRHPKTKDVTISFNKFAESSLNILVSHSWGALDYNEYLAGMQELNLTIKQRFEAEGIHFASPSQTLHVRQDSAWRVSTVPPPPAEVAHETPV